MFRVLGSLQVGDGHTIRGARERRLLALLLLEAPAAVTTRALVEWVLGDDGADERALHVATARLRRQLRDLGAPATIDRVPTGLRFTVAGRDVDRLRFEHLVAEADEHREGAEQQRDRLREALALWRGDVLAGEAVPAHPTVTALAEARLTAVERLLEIELALTPDHPPVTEAVRWCHLHPERERLVEVGMLSLARAGRHREALQLYQVARAQLLEVAGLEPGPGLRDLERRILCQDPTVLPAPDGPRHNVPPEHTSLLGRQAELSRLAELLGRARLVTVTGPGGVGKTRVALRVAAEHLDRQLDEVWFVDLARAPSGGFAATAVLEALGLQPQPNRDHLETVAGHLAHRRVLLVLDNCEHVSDHVADAVTRLLATAPGLTVLATSREPLHLPPEHVVALRPLVVHDTDGGAGPAMQLFLERAEMAGGILGDEPPSADLVASICARLDGLPLAIELAASRASRLSLRDIQARLDDRFRLLTGPNRGGVARHQTLEATIDWSYGLLPPPARDTFCRLSVFAGGFDDEAAMAVSGSAGPDVSAVLDQLVDRSLVVATRGHDGGTRFSMLESIRQYGMARLTETGHRDDVGRAYLRWIASMVEAASPHLQVGDPDWMDRMDGELANVRAVLDWATREPRWSSEGLDIVVGLGRYWYQRGITGEGAQWIASLRRLSPPLERPAEARALCELGFYLLQDGRPDEAAPYLQGSLALARQVDDPALLTRVLHYVSRSAFGVDDPEHLLTMVEEGRAIAVSLGDRLHLYLHSIIRTIWFLFYGDGATAQRIGWQFVRQFSGDPSPHIAAHVQETAAWLALIERDSSTAAPHLRAAFLTLRELRNPACTCHALETLAWWHAVEGRTQEALDVLDAVLRIREAQHHVRAAYESAPYHHVAAILGQEAGSAPGPAPFTDLSVALDLAVDQLCSS